MGRLLKTFKIKIGLMINVKENKMNNHSVVDYLNDRPSVLKEKKKASRS